MRARTNAKTSGTCWTSSRITGGGAGQARAVTARLRERRYLFFLFFLAFLVPFFWAPPLPDWDPDRRRPELPRVCFFDPVPDAPGRLPLFFFAFAARLATTLRPPGASALGPVPRRFPSGPD
jgi:hypothetical protein